MQSNDTARRSLAPENSPTLPAPVRPETRQNRLIALGHSAIKTAIEHPKTAIVIAGAIVIAVIAMVSPTAATGLLFAGGLYQINQFIDTRMAGGDS